MFLKHSDSPLLTQEVLRKLRNHGADMVPVFMARDSEALTHLCGLSYSSVVNLKKLLGVKYGALSTTADRIVQTQHNATICSVSIPDVQFSMVNDQSSSITPSCCGDSVIALPSLSGVGKAYNSPVAIPLQSSALTALLGGGLWSGEMVEVCGPSNTGKSQFCVSSSLAVIDHGFSVLYIDTKNKFSVGRCHEILRSMGRSSSTITNSLERLQVCFCSTQYEILSVLESVRNSKRLQNCLRLIVIDSIYPPLASMMHELQNTTALGFLQELAITLKALAADLSLTVLVANRAVPRLDAAHRDAAEWVPAFGLPWLSVPHVRIILHDRTNSPGTLRLEVPPLREAVLSKSYRLPANRRAAFAINTSGVCDA